MTRPLLGLLCTAIALLAQPRITNARISSTAGAEIKALIGRQADPAWLGYTTASVPGEYNSCMLERQPISDGPRTQTQSKVMLEGSREIYVLLRVEGGQAIKIRSLSPDCELDAGNLPFLWLTGVSAQASLSLLDSFVPMAATGRERMAENAIAAIALHAGTDADKYLAKYIDASRPEEVRKKTAFWLGSARGRKGFEALVRLLESDPSDRVKEAALHGLTVSKEPQALAQLIESARNDKSQQVRGKALFWLSQKASKESASVIRGAIESDPEMRVKENAVFALSQLPKEQSVPILIDLARSNKSPQVRKKAIFWLGQSKDPKALAYFEELLTR